MKLGMFSIYDSKTLVFGTPFFAVNKGAAIRLVVDAVRDGDSMLSKHTGDFVLFWVGEFDQDSGFVGAVAPGPENMGPLVQFLPAPSEAPLLERMK